MEGRGRIEMHTVLWLENLKKKEARLEDLGVNGTGLDSSGSKLGLVAGCCEQGDGPSISIKCGKFLV